MTVERLRGMVRAAARREASLSRQRRRPGIDEPAAFAAGSCLRWSAPQAQTSLNSPSTVSSPEPPDAAPAGSPSGSPASPSPAEPLPEPASDAEAW